MRLAILAAIRMSILADVPVTLKPDEAEEVLARLESGDRAREALRQVEPFEMFTWCPWCGKSRRGGGHAPDCPRQIALGLQDPQP
jgi:hypothetical protein